MCGIIGYLGNGNGATIVMEGLKNLEYRGYDSFGFALRTNKGIEIVKKVGKIGDSQGLFLKETDMAMGHTRWATHGAVTQPNAHPHTDCSGSVVIVHNGVIENYQELRKELKEGGHKLNSETDTEVIAHMIEEYCKKMSFVDATKKAIKRLEGSYAILAMKDTESVMIAARKGSPMVLGVGKGEYFVASDIPAFLKHTKKVVYMYDEDLAVISDDLIMYNLKTGAIVERPVDTVEWNVEQAKKGSFPDYMLKEISEQAETIKRASEQDPSIINKMAERIKQAYGVFFVAAGSSYHACLAASYIFSKVSNRHINVVLASEFPNYEHFLTNKTLVIAVSQSGETMDVLKAVKAAKNQGSEIISLVNVMGSSLTRYSDHFLMMHAGPEICVLSTKTYTSQVALLLLLAYACAGEYEAGKDNLEFAWNQVYNLTSRNTREFISNLAEKLKDKEHMFLIGRGVQYATALEAALKIKEVSYIHAEGFAGGELKHGTIALIEKGTPCIVFSNGDNEKETVSNAMEIKARGAYIIGVGPRNNEVYDYFIKVPEMEYANPIGQIIPMQILAHELAVLRGCNVDKPRNLAKSVTVP
ncbi:MAG: glutamine--fructose-6-phosphate transaminase (isomerizing) [Candidatus Aenigmatarchaeota archaeon]